MEKVFEFRNYSWLFVCGALAAGEFVASRMSGASGLWIFCTLAAVLIALFGYGVGVKGWHLVVVFFLGAALYFHASMKDEEVFRLHPWMKESVERRRQRPCSSAAAVRLRRDLSKRVGIGLSDVHEVASLNRAILLGERRGISPNARRAFVESGAIHVFAISGLHVMAIARLLTFILCCSFVPRRFSGLLAIPILWLYIWAVGAPASAIRAGMMSTLCYLAPVFGRRPDGIMAWSLTFLIVHLFDPYKISDIGSVLSFAVMLSILVASKSGESSAFTGALRIAVAAWAVGAPITAYHFGRLTPGGMLSSLALIPSATISVSVGVAGLAASFISPIVAAHLNRLSGLFTEAMAALANVLASLPFSNFETGRWTLSVCFLWYAFLGVALWISAYFRQKRRSRIL
jgi:competence protein ComEC